MTLPRSFWLSSATLPRSSYWLSSVTLLRSFYWQSSVTLLRSSYWLSSGTLPRSFNWLSSVTLPQSLYWLGMKPTDQVLTSFVGSLRKLQSSLFWHSPDAMKSHMLTRSLRLERTASSVHPPASASDEVLCTAPGVPNLGSPLALFWRHSVLSCSSFRHRFWRRLWRHLLSWLRHVLSAFRALFQSALLQHRCYSENCLRAALHCGLFLRDTRY